MYNKDSFNSFCVDQDYENTSIKQILDSGDDAWGKKVYIVSHSRSYTGVISHIFKETYRIWLEQVTIVEKDYQLHSVLTLFFSDVLHIAICGDNNKIRKRIFKELYGELQSNRLMTKPILPQSIAEQEASAELFEINPFSNEISDEYHESIFEVEPSSPYSQMPRPTCYYTVEDIDNFKEAFELIEKESVIGVSTIDSIGRNGGLIWLAIATSTHVFLVDFLNIDIEDALEVGLKNLLTSEYIVKVISSAQGLEDYFYHQHQFKMENVYVPEVMDIYISMHRGEKIPSIYKDLKVLLKNYLKIDKKNIPHYYSDMALRLDWNCRPLPEVLREYLYESVFLLRELHQSLLDCILQPLSILFKDHLGALRERDIYGSERYDKTIVPISIQNAKERYNNIIPKLILNGIKGNFK